MKVSLVLATKDRIEELERFLHSLAKQRRVVYELIVVDQNEDDRLVPVLKPFEQHMEILRVTSEPGASRARNAGLQYVTGDVVGFPDDDCWYHDPYYLSRVSDFFQQNPTCCVLTGLVEDQEGKILAGAKSASPRRLTRYNCWRLANATTLFVRRDVLVELNGFDEMLGPGSGTRWTSAEDIDFVIRALDRGYEAWYSAHICVKHPPVYRGPSAVSNRKVFNYGRGAGFVLRKHNYPAWFVSYYIGRPLFGSVLKILSGDVDSGLFYYFRFKGRLLGYLRK